MAADEQENDKSDKTTGTDVDDSLKLTFNLDAGKSNKSTIDEAEFLQHGK